MSFCYENSTMIILRITLFLDIPILDRTDNVSFIR